MISRHTLEGILKVYIRGGGRATASKEVGLNIKSPSRYLLYIGQNIQAVIVPVPATSNATVTHPCQNSLVSTSCLALGHLGLIDKTTCRVPFTLRCQNELDGITFV